MQTGADFIAKHPPPLSPPRLQGGSLPSPVERGELSHFVKSAKALLKFTRIRVYPVRSVLIRVLFFALSG